MSAFHAKGVAFTGLLEYTKRRVPGGIDAVLARLGPDERAFFEQIFLATGWYDLFAFERFMSAAADLEGIALVDFARRQGRAAAGSDVRGIYRRSLEAHSAEDMAARLPRAFNRYFEPTAAELCVAAPGHMHGTLRSVPLRLEDFFRATNEGFVKEALSIAGARDARMTWETPELAAPLGHTRVTHLSFHVHW